MNLHLLPVRTAGAAENMALDFLLLQRYPVPAPRFRHYEWRGPACTFGFSQKIGFVRANLPSFAKASEGPPAGEHFDLCRRPTGGGIVDHRHDWTYALVLPRGHALYDGRAAQSYRIVHEGLAAALAALGQPAAVKMECDKVESCGSDLGRDKSRASTLPQTGEGVCFQRAELHDVVNTATGAKIAGAAQKRNKHGLLFQGSIEKSAVGPVDWEEFSPLFSAALARTLGAEAQETPWPDLNEDEVSGLIGQYSSPEWIECR
ncbi:MAG: lipoate--protein ligase family protein [Opitutae bacterium]|nr:lipoate--protein ligase family protein [Opitutae bacterium]